MHSAERPLVMALRSGLAALADPVAAPAMQRYMRSTMPFRGVAKPERERLLRTVLAEHPVRSPTELTDVVQELWTAARFREERYLALAVTGHRTNLRWQEPSWVPLYRDWIVTGAWWDFTDEIASRRVGPLLRAHPADLTPTLREWSRDPDRWLRRTSITCQLGSDADSDTDLLTATIEASIDDPDFFLRKGIGWALRQHSRTDPAWVRSFVATHPQLSPLSRKEALRHLGGA